MTKKYYVLDTSVYLTDYRAIYSYGNNNIIIPLIVLEELDRCKKRPNGVGANARGIIRILDELRTSGSFQKGIRIRKGAGQISTMSPNLNELPEGYDPIIADHQIIATAITAQKTYPTRKVVVVSNDINLRIKCDAIGVAADSYKTEQVIEAQHQLYSGFKKILVDDQFIDRFYSGEKIFLDDIDYSKILYPNQFIMLVSSSNEKKTAIARFIK